MQAEPDRLQPLSANAHALLSRLSRQFGTALFDIDAAAELIEHGYARQSGGSLDITSSGLLYGRAS